ncbi:GIY-YIG nuclease family protein [Subtercola sp. RTI3]|uniref:GIY-YIG nuclease family protein n=1 Tax=Subtercola sp. RTI3 TaxID=3048639 RepID=UPI002B2340A6|nr:GIY-YIG nuclease family protein [Subtercola sp. RTI3]MEA9984604.1 GIY-YIG nuclease family protein [Subtercola sp. RTI3]
MTPFDITSFRLTSDEISAWVPLDRRYKNWPVVYVLDNADAVRGRPSIRNQSVSDVYVGESLNAAARMRQHLDSDAKKHLTTVRVIIDETFNKSVCLDLESYLIRMLAGDGVYQVLNRNDGITESAYYERERYEESFEQVFEQLKNDGVFIRSIPEIENSDLFKLSPFKALSQDQAVAVEGILEGLFIDLESTALSTSVIQGEPGTGMTVGH